MTDYAFGAAERFNAKYAATSAAMTAAPTKANPRYPNPMNAWHVNESNTGGLT